MKSLFDADAYHEMVTRINHLSENSQRQWGKMDVSQMMAHCCQAFKVPLSNTAYPRMFMGYVFGWMMKSKLYNDVPYSHNLPTAPDFLIRDERNFAKEKESLLSLVDRFHKHGKETAGKFPHPFFGTFTAEQWGMSMYKHLDHHLRQFGS